MTFKDCPGLVFVQSGLTLADGVYCQGRGLKTEVNQNLIYAQSVATFKSLESMWYLLIKTQCWQIFSEMRKNVPTRGIWR